MDPHSDYKGGCEEMTPGPWVLNAEISLIHSNYIHPLEIFHFFTKAGFEDRLCFHPEWSLLAPQTRSGPCRELHGAICPIRPGRGVRHFALKESPT